MRSFNYSAGPSVLPVEVLEQVKAELLDFGGSGMSVMEMSHRGKFYDRIHAECLSLIRELMHVPEDYDILLMQGGGSTQFEAVPLNLMTNHKKADYVLTGVWATKAYKEAKRYGDAAVAATSEDANFTYIPDVKTISFRPDIDYGYITLNNTIYGTHYTEYPTLSAPLVGDASSNIMAEELPVEKFGLLFAGAQKNLGPAGVTVVIVKKDLLGHESEFCPTMMKYSTHAAKNSLYNTPPTFAIYVMMLNLRYLKKFGGVKEMEAFNKAKSKKLYDFIDESGFYVCPNRADARSLVNIPFVTPSAELDAKFVKEAEAQNLHSLKGHKLVGGLRASLYNGMPMEGVDALISFMKDFEARNK